MIKQWYWLWRLFKLSIIVGIRWGITVDSSIKDPKERSIDWYNRVSCTPFKYEVQRIRKELDAVYDA